VAGGWSRKGDARCVIRAGLASVFESSCQKDITRIFQKDERVCKERFMGMSICIGHSPQTRSFAPAATFARVRLRNFCWRKRPSFLASRRFA
jgi:hypothetical protein